MDRFIYAISRWYQISEVRAADALDELAWRLDSGYHDIERMDVETVIGACAEYIN